MSQTLTSSILRHQQAWGLHAHGHHAVSFLQLVGVLVSVKQLKNVHHTLLSMSVREELKILLLYYTADLLFKLLPVLLTQLPSFVITCSYSSSYYLLSQPFVSQGRPGRLTLLQTRRRGHGGVRSLSREGPIGSCSVTQAPTQSVGLSSGLGCMLQADKGANAFLGDGKGRSPKLANVGERKGKEKRQETTEKKKTLKTISIVQDEICPCFTPNKQKWSCHCFTILL